MVSIEELPREDTIPLKELPVFQLLQLRLFGTGRTVMLALF